MTSAAAACRPARRPCQVPYILQRPHTSGPPRCRCLPSNQPAHCAEYIKKSASACHRSIAPLLTCPLSSILMSAAYCKKAGANNNKSFTFLACVHFFFFLKTAFASWLKCAARTPSARVPGVSCQLRIGGDASASSARDRVHLPCYPFVSFASQILPPPRNGP